MRILENEIKILLTLASFEKLRVPKRQLGEAQRMKNRSSLKSFSSINEEEDKDAAGYYEYRDPEDPNSRIAFLLRPILAEEFEVSQEVHTQHCVLS